ncbi:unnamed protein product [Symbiodinium sp. KB8]|nr:unnamed protein product [Symbiodinium sp. KB8]
MRGKTPSVRLLQRSQHQDVNRDVGRRVYEYNNCGRKTTKASAAVQKYLLGRLLVLRRRATCTATTLQQELLANKGVDLEESTMRKILRGQGCEWLPRAQKRKCSADLSMGIDGVSFFLAATLSVPDTRRVGRAIVGSLLQSGVAMCCEVRRGKLAKAMQSIAPVPRAGSNSPVEKMWAWLQRRVRAKDCEDLRKRRHPIGKMAFKARVRSMFASKQAQRFQDDLQGSGG